MQRQVVIPQKIQTGGIEDLEFSGILKSMWKSQGSIKKEVKFPGVCKENLCGIGSMGLSFSTWNFQRMSHNFAEFPEVKACFLWDF